MNNAPSRNGTSELAWHKSSYSTNEGGDCVEVAATPAAVLVRDSKTPGTAHLALTTESWAAFVGTLTA